MAQWKLFFPTHTEELRRVAASDEAGRWFGDHIEGFRVIQRLGAGGYAEVFLAEQEALSRQVALKVLDIGLRDTDVRQRFTTECRAIGGLSWHRNVVTVYEAGFTENQRPYLAMEYLPDGSLADRLAASGPMPWSDVVGLGVQIADALDAAHAAGVLHRDLKPANLMVDRFGDYRLGDFGIARFAESTQTATGAVAATIPYAAPEILSGERASEASDVYGLGATLHALVAGSAPFSGEAGMAPMARILKVVNEPAPSLAAQGVPAPFADMVLRMLAKDPAARPRGAARAGAELQAVQRQLGLPVTPMRSQASLTAPVAAVAAPAAERAGDKAGERAQEANAARIAALVGGTDPPASAPVAPDPVPPAPAAPDPAPDSPDGPRRSRRGRWLAAAAVLVALLVAGGIALAVTGGDDDEDAAPPPSTSATTPSTAPPSSTTSPSTTEAPSSSSTTAPPSSPSTTTPDAMPDASGVTANPDYTEFRDGGVCLTYPTYLTQSGQGAFVSADGQVELTYRAEPGNIEARYAEARSGAMEITYELPGEGTYAVSGHLSADRSFYESARQRDGGRLVSFRYEWPRELRPVQEAINFTYDQFPGCG